MKHSNVSLMFVASTLCMLAVACGGDDNDGKSEPTSGTGPNLGLSADRQMNSLTDDEIAQVNKAVGEYSTQQISASLTTQQLCEYSGVMGALALGMFGGDEAITDASLQQSCTSVTQECVKSPSAATETAQDSTSEDPVTKAELADCNATVGEYQACVKDSIAAMTTMMKSLPKCTELKAASLESTMTSTTPTQEPASCQTLAQKCPGSVSDSDDTLSE